MLRPVSPHPPVDAAPGLLLHPADDVAIVLADVAAGPRVRAGTDEVVARLAREVFEAILAVASGRRTKSEELGFGTEEFNPWLIGAVM